MRSVLILTWVWLALQAAVGDEAAADAGLAGPLLAAVVLCLAGLLVFRGGDDAARPVRPVQQSPRREMHWRTGNKILADRRRNSVPVLNTPALQPRVRVLRDGHSRRAGRDRVNVKDHIDRDAGRERAVRGGGGERRGRIVA